MGISSASAQPPPAAFGPAAAPGTSAALPTGKTSGSSPPAATGRVEPPRGLAFALVLKSKLGTAPPALSAAAVGTVPLAAALPRSRDATTRTARRGQDEDVLLPTFRHTTQLAPPPAATLVASQTPAQGAPFVAGGAGARALDGRSLASLEDLLPALVRKIAWSGDARRGSVRLELGAGALSGGTLLVRAEGAQVHVALHAPPGTDVEDWRARIATRLAARGLDVTAVDVE